MMKGRKRRWRMIRKEEEIEDDKEGRGDGG